MPSLPSKTARRKHVTPIANLHENDVWQRTFKLLGLQPLTPFPNVAPDRLERSRTFEMASTADIEAPPTGNAEPKKLKITILDLPAETQKDIFKHASSTDLIALSLVSKHFRDIAAAQLYRNFHIVFPDEDDPSYESPIDGLAGGLDTLVTSEYNYAKYLKEIVLDTLSGGSKGERAYRHYTYDLSCGKFMNTLFLLTLRKAHALETFKWDLRVEISRPVFKALHQISALQNLHLRMQAGPSIYETPPPLPSLEESDSATSSANPSSSSLGPSTPHLPGSNSYPSAKNALKSKSKISKDVAHLSKVPPTISGFKNLKSLSVLDMDTLDYITEIKACLRASSSTLSKLKLSFSENLARQARKPPPAEDPGDESDQEMDEFGNMIPPPPPPPLPSSTEDAAGPAKAFRAQEEKKAQEAVLGRIFGVEPFTLKKGDGGLENASDSEDKVEEEKTDAGKAFIKDLTTLSKKLMISVNGPGTRTQQQKDALEIIEKAAKKYIEAREEEQAKLEKEKKTSDGVTSEGSGTAKVTPESSTASVSGKNEDENMQEGKPKDSEAHGKSGLFESQQSKDRKSNQMAGDGPNPDDINVEDPEVEADPRDFDDVAPSEAQTEDKTVQPTESGPSDPVSNATSIAELTADDRLTVALASSKRAEVMVQLENFKILKAKLRRHKAETEELNKRITDIAAAKEVDQAALNEAQRQQLRLQAEVDSATAQMNALGSEVADLKQRAEVVHTSQEQYQSKMSEYIRNTRGLGLRSLSIYLIPIKASVLSKSIDITVLKRISLLNVGPQAPFWILLAKENKTSPLPLQKIYTDNVTLHFLTLASQLDLLIELFMLERNSKVPEYSFAPKTTVTIDQIRKLVLKKHVGMLRKLMIKNENDYTWDTNEQVIKLLCKRGKRLEELAVSFGVQAVHTFNQYLPGLVNLRAMHIINFRNDDTCHWVIREIRKFAVDSVSHNPEMKLEYIALENTVERLVRRLRKPKSKGKGKAAVKGKGNEAEMSQPSAAFPTLESILSPPVASESSEDETVNSEDDVGSGLKLETLEGVRFYDIYGVRIFRKDVMMGRL